MNWSTLLLSLTGYSWYLVFIHLTHETHPGFWTGLAGLFILALLPAGLGLTAHRSLLATGPTVLKLALTHLLLFLLYTGLTVPGSLLTADYLFWNPSQPLAWTAYLFPTVWQLLGWLCGAFVRTSGIKTVEISLGLMLPAVFILTFMGFAGPLLLTLAAGWFLALALTLAVEGVGVAETSAIRYDIVLFHALVPPLAAAVLFAVAFFGELRSLMQAARDAFYALLGFLVALLDRLSPPAAPGAPPPPMPVPPMSGGEMEKVQEPASWFIYVLIGMMVLFLIPLLRALPGLLKMRLKAAPRLPRRRYSPLRALLQAGRWLFALLGSLLKIFAPAVKLLKTAAGRLRQTIKAILRRWLPAKTPGQKIFRSYEVFLRLGRRRGCPRQAHETPLEYARRLQAATAGGPFPAAEINRLTGLFLEAGYSNRPVTRRQAAESEQLLKTIALAL